MIEKIKILLKTKPFSIFFLFLNTRATQQENMMGFIHTQRAEFLESTYKKGYIDEIRNLSTETLFQKKDISLLRITPIKKTR